MKPTTPLEKAKENPWLFFSIEEGMEIFGFGRDTMRALAAAGAPIVAKKFNPTLLWKWLEENADKVGKIRTEGRG